MACCQEHLKRWQGLGPMLDLKRQIWGSNTWTTDPMVEGQQWAGGFLHNAFGAKAIPRWICDAWMSAKVKNGGRAAPNLSSVQNQHPQHIGSVVCCPLAIAALRGLFGPSGPKERALVRISRSFAPALGTSPAPTQQHRHQHQIPPGTFCKSFSQTTFSFKQ
ncbi:hypothetical protein BO78DRAFT_420326 [Aspergillus sclerotiicarbonarius CBS 121057]|uniref:Uncharacterized protein n=1 Tax=Aspergillus sclerotiicarbonarius (strain CBS 121057 / IBT 28362) TaxID=1448318 RepID=A0A319E497_ASPSB|nr:hypothetical protein BO78DRAFT_420326 [Aspergillus sclerotiicarbonarius CBS 121057]